jgi:hypothetical protein
MGTEIQLFESTRTKRILNSNKETEIADVNLNLISIYLLTPWSRVLPEKLTVFS